MDKNCLTFSRRLCGLSPILPSEQEQTGQVKGGKDLIEQEDSKRLGWIMKVFLHDGKTGLYYADCNRWADKLEEGHDFGNIENAMRTNYQRGLSATEVVVISEKPAGVIR